jgi:flagellar biogenesis protein FliO
VRNWINDASIVPPALDCTNGKGLTIVKVVNANKPILEDGKLSLKSLSGEEISMSTATASGLTAKAGARPAWLTLGIIAAVAVAAGLLVPQMLPGDMVLDKNHPKAEAKKSAKDDYVAPQVPDMPNPQTMLTKLALGTLLVLGLSVASIVAMRRWLQPAEAARNGPRSMKLLETLPLGNRCSLHLVHLGKREVLIGVDAAGIKTIVPLTEPFEEVLQETEANVAA